MAGGPAVLMPAASGINRPIDVVQLAGLPVDDKRAILASWASDYHAVRSRPSMRWIPGTPNPVAIAEIKAALVELDRRYDI
ncbi:hypothetical protein LAC79_36325 (plasmid) [Ensifer adhaerens]|nr:hypothetical protein [Ensifer adhaerens]MBZ7927219.1 hypothetical protein [Ensifer adhaerens]